MDLSDLPNITPGALQPLNHATLAAPDDAGHPPRILLLYGSLRPVSYSRLCAEEGARVLRALGCETRFFDPPACRCPMTGLMPTTPRSPNCAILRFGPKAWSGPALNGTAR